MEIRTEIIKKSFVLPWFFVKVFFSCDERIILEFTNNKGPRKVFENVTSPPWIYWRTIMEITNIAAIIKISVVFLRNLTMVVMCVTLLSIQHLWKSIALSKNKCNFTQRRFKSKFCLSNVPHLGRCSNLSNLFRE